MPFFVRKFCHFQFDAYFSLFFSKMSSKWPTATRKTANVFKIITCWLWNWLYDDIYPFIHLSESFPGFFEGGTMCPPPIWSPYGAPKSLVQIGLTLIIVVTKIYSSSLWLWKLRQGEEEKFVSPGRCFFISKRSFSSSGWGWGWVL